MPGASASAYRVVQQHHDQHFLSFGRQPCLYLLADGQRCHHGGLEPILATQQGQQDLLTAGTLQCQQNSPTVAIQQDRLGLPIQDIPLSQSYLPTLDLLEDQHVLFHDTQLNGISHTLDILQSQTTLGGGQLFLQK